jgi:hypothetical protein
MKPISLKALTFVSLLCLVLSNRIFANTDASPDELWDYCVHRFDGDEAGCTVKLNDLTRAGWDYVGPVNANMVAFRRKFVLKLNVVEEKTTQGLDLEALEKARSGIYSRILVDGDDAFGKSFPFQGFGQGRSTSGIQTAVQFKGFSWSLIKESLDEAERLNEFEWKGYLLVSTKLEREWFARDLNAFRDGPATWTQWGQVQTPIKRYALIKRKVDWKLQWEGEFKKAGDGYRPRGGS